MKRIGVVIAEGTSSGRAGISITSASENRARWRKSIGEDTEREEKNGKRRRGRGVQKIEVDLYTSQKKLQC